MHLLLFAFVAIITKPLSSFAWGGDGHEIVATIAQIYLLPQAHQSICEILGTPDCRLSSIANWADKARNRMPWSKTLHYVNAIGDHPPSQCLFPGPQGWAGEENMNLLHAITNVTSVLVDYQNHDASEDAASEALKFLVHFMGDMHQPLHLTGRARGGNDIKVTFDGRRKKFHATWDSTLLDQRMEDVPSNYSQPLLFPSIEHHLHGSSYDPFVRRVFWEGIFARWPEEVLDWPLCPAGRPVPTNSPKASPFWQPVVRLLFSHWSRQPQDDIDTDVVCPYAWAQPIQQLNCDFIWPAALDLPPYSEDVTEVHPRWSATSFASRPKLLELNTPEYYGVLSENWVIEKLLAQAGVRLAGVLNLVFGGTSPPEAFTIQN